MSEKLRSFDRQDSEKWHARAIKALHATEVIPFGLSLAEKLAEQHKRFSDQRLHVVLAGIEFDNPLMVGAGWDKAGRAIAALYRLGFSGVEVGSVVRTAQTGNQRPRQWMVAPGVALNNLGFNSPGMEKVGENLDKYVKKDLETGVVGISIGKNSQVNQQDSPDAYASVARFLYPYADYFVINVSSPSTPGLRKLQAKEHLRNIVYATVEAMESNGQGRKPLFIKIAPDNLGAEAIAEVIEVVLDNNLSGIVAVNSTTDSRIKGIYGSQWSRQSGGLSGDDPEFRAMANAAVKHIYRETNGGIDIIGVGGIKDTESALARIKYGAKVVQVVTAIRGDLPLAKAFFQQPKLPGRINRGLVEWMDKKGVRSLEEIRGIDA